MCDYLSKHLCISISHALTSLRLSGRLMSLDYLNRLQIVAVARCKQHISLLVKFLILRLSLLLNGVGDHIEVVL
jgi:hypothetical protein